VYKLYCRSYQYQQLLKDSNVDIASPAVALHRFRNLRLVRILKDFSNTFDNWSLLNSSFTNSQAGVRFFKMLTSALRVLELGIKELMLGSFCRKSPSLIRIVQCLHPIKLEFY
jgi:hypothetical protein